VPVARRRWYVLSFALALVAAACGGGDDAASDLPAGCDNSSPLQVSFDGVLELSSEFTAVGGVALPFALIPGEESLVDLSDEELAAAVELSDLVGYAIAVTDFPYGVDDAGSFYSLFSSPTLPEEGGTVIMLTVIPPNVPLASGSVVEVGTPLAYEDQMQSTLVSTSVFFTTNRVEDVPFLGGAPTDFTGTVEVLAIADGTICVSWSTSSPVFSGDELGFATVSGVVSAPLQALQPRNSMG
jgi:hypothetical protein